MTTHPAGDAGSAAMLAHVARTSPLGVENAVYQLYGTPRRPESDEPDAVRECSCGFTETFIICHETLRIIDHYCSRGGDGCDGDWGRAIREGRVTTGDVLELLWAEEV